MTVKIRLEGTMDELNEAVRRVREAVFVQSVSKPYKNRNSDRYRIYVDAELWATTPTVELMPSAGGKDCPANGEHEDIECQCDECDYMAICHPTDDNPFFEGIVEGLLEALAYERGNASPKTVVRERTLDGASERGYN